VAIAVGVCDKEWFQLNVSQKRFKVVRQLVGYAEIAANEGNLLVAGNIGRVRKNDFRR